MKHSAQAAIAAPTFTAIYAQTSYQSAQFFGRDPGSFQDARKRPSRDISGPMRRHNRKAAVVALQYNVRTGRPINPETRPH
jgi:hypothetical protein